MSDSRRCVPVAAAVCLLLAAGAAPAAEEGALEPVACDPADGLAYPNDGRISINRPVGAGAGTTDAKARFGTRRLGDITISLAMDRTRPGTIKPDTVRIAFDGSGKFGPKSAVPLTNPRSPREGYFLAEFGPGVVPVSRAGRTYPVGIRGSYIHVASARGGMESTRSGRRAFYSFAAAVEGQCRFGGRTRAVRFLDTTGNFRFDDAPKPKPRTFSAGTGDLVLIDTGDGTFGGQVVRACYGQSVCVDGAWYDVAVSADGTKATVTPAKVAAGSLSVAAGRWELALVGDGKTLLVHGGKAPAGVPAGRYDVLHYRQWSAADNQGRRAVLMAGLMEYADGKPASVTVAEGKTTTFTAGPPLTTTLTAKPNGTSVELRTGTLTMRGGLSVFRLTPPGGWIYDRPKCPQLRIRDAAGKPVAAFSLPFK